MSDLQASHHREDANRPEGDWNALASPCLILLSVDNRSIDRRLLVLQRGPAQSGNSERSLTNNTGIVGVKWVMWLANF